LVYTCHSKTNLKPIFSHFNGSEWGENGRRMGEEWCQKANCLPDVNIYEAAKQIVNNFF
jgi:hypothetical protein